MGNRIGVRELRESLTTVLRAVEAGQSYEVTRDSIVVAVLGPADRRPIDRLIERGEASTPIPLDQPLRRRRASDRSASAHLADDRDE